MQIFHYLCTRFNTNNMKRTLFLLLAALSICSACTHKKPQSKLLNETISVKAMVVGDTLDNSSRTYIGQLLAGSEIPLSFRLGGNLVELPVRSGAHVRKGQVIARVDDTQMRSMYESAEAVLAQAEDGYNRAKPVYEKGGVSELKWKEVETNVQKARSMHATSKKNLEECTLVAPKDGIIQLGKAEEGMGLMPGQRIGELLDISELKAEFTVPESEVNAMEIGQKIRVIIPSLNAEADAIIREKDFSATAMAHTYRVDALLQGKNPALLPGMVCKAYITNTSHNGRIIPSNCVMTQRQGLSVWVIKNGLADRRIIRVGEFVKNGVLVADGLQPGDTIVTMGYQKLFVGAKVKIEK